MLPKLILASVLVLAVAIAAMMLIRSRRPKNEYVIGRELAEARENEDERLKRKDLKPSPLPAGEYARPPDEYGLLNPQPEELDARLREICVTYRALGESERADFRAAVSMQEFYRLLEFSRRLCVFALRTDDAVMLSDANTAISMIEAKRVDYRDLLMAIAMQRYAAGRIGMDTQAEIERAAKLAEPGTRALFLNILERKMSDSSLLESMGLREVDTRFGRGLVSFGFRNYRPSTNLLQVAIGISELVSKDAYVPAGIEIGTEIPEIWLKSDDPDPLQTVLQEVTAGATINAALTAGHHPKPEAQQFVVFLVETRTPEAATALEEIAHNHRATWHSVLGVASGKLFALVVARSFVAGVDSFETDDSIRRFEPGIRDVLVSAQRDPAS